MDNVKNFEIQEIIWYIFIFLAILNIYADDLMINFIKNNDLFKRYNAKKIFLFIIIVIFFIYLYFIIRDYKQLKYAKDNNIDLTNYIVRLIGSILLISAVLCGLFVQLNDQNESGTQIV